jgi:FlaA1/EpsC-like NDP-sugar epimerase
MGEGGEVFLFDMGEAVRILDLAKKMISLAGLEPGRDIEVQITGMRPGEKLHEELRSQAEDHLPTHHKKIMRIAHKAVVPQDLTDRIRACAVDRANHQAALDLLTRSIPEYQARAVPLGS